MLCLLGNEQHLQASAFATLMHMVQLVTIIQLGSNQFTLWIQPFSYVKFQTISGGKQKLSSNFGTITFLGTTPPHNGEIWRNGYSFPFNALEDIKIRGSGLWECILLEEFLKLKSLLWRSLIAATYNLSLPNRQNYLYLNQTTDRIKF